MLNTLLKVFARDLSKVVTFIKAIEDHVTNLIVKAEAEIKSHQYTITDIEAKAKLDIAKVEEKIEDAAHTIAIALGLKSAAAAATAPASGANDLNVATPEALAAGTPVAVSETPAS